MRSAGCGTGHRCRAHSARLLSRPAHRVFGPSRPGHHPGVFPAPGRADGQTGSTARRAAGTLTVAPGRRAGGRRDGGALDLSARGRRHLLSPALPGPEPAVAHRFSPPRRPRSDALRGLAGRWRPPTGGCSARPVPSDASPSPPAMPDAHPDDRHPPDRRLPGEFHTRADEFIPPAVPVHGPAGTGRSVTPRPADQSVRSAGRQTSSARQVQMNSFELDRRDPPPLTAADLGCPAARRCGAAPRDVTSPGAAILGGHEPQRLRRFVGAHEAWARIRQTFSLTFKFDIQSTIN